MKKDLKILSNGFSGRNLAISQSVAGWIIIFQLRFLLIFETIFLVKTHNEDCYSNQQLQWIN